MSDTPPEGDRLLHKSFLDKAIVKIRSSLQKGSGELTTDTSGLIRRLEEELSSELEITHQDPLGSDSPESDIEGAASSIQMEELSGTMLQATGGTDNGEKENNGATDHPSTHSSCFPSIQKDKRKNRKRRGKKRSEGSPVKSDDQIPSISKDPGPVVGLGQEEALLPPLQQQGPSSQSSDED